MRRDGAPIGAALWMPPTAGAAKALAKRLLNDETKHKSVLTLSRLVVRPGEPQNAAGILLGHTTGRAAKDARWCLLVTYADEAQGHEGTIYRATGWSFDGFTEPQTAWHIDGKQVSRLSTKSRTYEEMRAAGAVQSKSRKRRFYKLLPWFIGIERDEGYMEIASRRVEAARQAGPVEPEPQVAPEVKPAPTPLQAAPVQRVKRRAPAQDQLSLFGGT